MGKPGGGWLGVEGGAWISHGTGDTEPLQRASSFAGTPAVPNACQG